MFLNERPFHKRGTASPYGFGLGGSAGLGGAYLVAANDPDQAREFAEFQNEGDIWFLLELMNRGLADRYWFITATSTRNRAIFYKWGKLYLTDYGTPLLLDQLEQVNRAWLNPSLVPINTTPDVQAVNPDYQGLVPVTSVLPTPPVLINQNVALYLIPLSQAGFYDDFSMYMMAWQTNMYDALGTLLHYGTDPDIVQSVLYFAYLGTRYLTPNAELKTDLDVFMNSGGEITPKFAPNNNPLYPTGVRVPVPMPNGTANVSNPNYTLPDTDPNIAVPADYVQPYTAMEVPATQAEYQALVPYYYGATTGFSQPYADVIRQQAIDAAAAAALATTSTATTGTTVELLNDDSTTALTFPSAHVDEPPLPNDFFTPGSDADDDFRPDGSGVETVTPATTAAHHRPTWFYIALGLGVLAVLK